MVVKPPSLVDILARGLRDALDYIDQLEKASRDDLSNNEALQALKAELAEKDKLIAGLSSGVSERDLTISALHQQLAEALTQIESLSVQLIATRASLSADNEQLSQLTGLTDLITKLQAKVGNAATVITPSTLVINLDGNSNASAPTTLVDAPTPAKGDQLGSGVSATDHTEAGSSGDLPTTDDLNLSQSTAQNGDTATANADSQLSAATDPSADSMAARLDGTAPVAPGDAVAAPKPNGAV